MGIAADQLGKDYLKALREHLAHGPDLPVDAAEKLGCRAKRLKLDAADLAIIHEAALGSLARERGWGNLEETITQPGLFFRRALSKMFPVRTSDAARERRLQKEIDRRKTAEAALKASREEESQLLQQASEMQAQLRHLSHQIILAQEEERRTISRQLHDEISQILAGVNIQLATLQFKAVASTDELKNKISSTQRLVEKSMAAMHRFARELRPAALDDIGLVPTLAAYVTEIEAESGLCIESTFVPEAEIAALGHVERTVLYRVAQEALANTVRHAKASLALISLQVEAGNVCLTIKDNGRPFDVQRLLSSVHPKHLGILGMRERVQMVGGIFRIESERGKGTTVRAQIPLAKQTTQKDKP